MQKLAQKQEAIMLRKRGFSYTQIQERIKVPKATLSRWLRNIDLTEVQINSLRARRLHALHEAREKKKMKMRMAIEAVRNSAARDVQKISKRELWLMGVMLYRRERMYEKQSKDLYKGVRFSSSDPMLIKFFLHWLTEVGGLKHHEINLDIFLSAEKKEMIHAAVTYWSEATGFSRNQFSRIYFFKHTQKNTETTYKGSGENGGRELGSRKVSKSRYGFLRIRVRESSMLARQIAGWISAIEKLILE